MREYAYYVVNSKGETVGYYYLMKNAERAIPERIKVDAYQINSTDWRYGRQPEIYWYVKRIKLLDAESVDL